jgi:hypothetical protein
MTSDEPNIDPESPALQYRVLDRGDVWVLERAAPGYPRTPAENQAVREARGILPTDNHGRILVRPALQERIDAEPGGTISLSAVISAKAAVIGEAMQAVLDPVLDMMSEAAESVLSAFDDILAPNGSEASDHWDRLPAHVREARSRRDRQREQERSAADSRYPEGGSDGQ